MTHDAGAIQNVSDLRAHFRQELSEALTVLKIRTTEETEAYVVQVLDGFVRPDAQRHHALGFTQPAALMLEQALGVEGEQRISALRKLGDACLYHCGFFEANLTRRGVELAYYQKMGRVAYGSLRDMLEVRRPGDVFTGIFRELEGLFEPLVRALKQIAAPTLLRSPDADEVLARWARQAAMMPGPLFKL